MIEGRRVAYIRQMLIDSTHTPKNTLSRPKQEINILRNPLEAAASSLPANFGWPCVEGDGIPRPTHNWITQVRFLPTCKEIAEYDTIPQALRLDTQAQS